MKFKVNTQAKTNKIKLKKVNNRRSLQYSKTAPEGVEDK